VERPPQIRLDDARLAAAHARSRLAFHRLLATGSPRARTIELLGVQALAVPIRPRLPIVNCVFAYDHVSSLEAALPELCDVYAELGVAAWGVWVLDRGDSAAELLVAAGFDAHTTGRRMAGYIRPENIEPQLELELVAEPTWRLLGECSDRAYGLPEEAGLAAAFAGISDPAAHVYAAKSDGRIVAALVAREALGDCYLSFVATLPEFRGLGIGGELVRHALRLALERGCTSASGESTPGALSLYQRVGARDLGGLRLWVRRA